MDVNAIFQGLATAAATIPGLRTYATPPDSVNPPVFTTVAMDLAYHQTFGTTGMSAIHITCGVYTSAGDTDAGRKLLIGYLSATGAQSILAALEADKTLGGACSTLVVDSVHDAFRLYDINGVQFLGAEFDLRVWAT